MNPFLAFPSSFCSILINVLPSLLSDFFPPSHVPTKALYVLLYVPLRTTCSSLGSILEVITRITRTQFNAAAQYAGFSGLL